MGGVSEDARNAAVPELVRVPSSLTFQRSDEYVFTMLVNRIRGRRYNPFVFDYDLYGNEGALADMGPVLASDTRGGPRPLLFYTKLKRSKSTNIRFERTVGSGTWHRSISGIKIAFGDGLGTMKAFSYKNSKSKQDGRWIMHDFSLPDTDDSWVICRIRKRTSKEREVSSGDGVKNNATLSEPLDQTQRDSTELLALNPGIHRRDSPAMERKLNPRVLIQH